MVKIRRAVQGQWRSTRTCPDNTCVNAHSACKVIQQVEELFEHATEGQRTTEAKKTVGTFSRVIGLWSLLGADLN